MTKLYILIGKVYCFFGAHHYHDLDQEDAIKRLPKHVHVTGKYCCRCYNVVLDTLTIDADQTGESVPSGSKQAPK